MTDQEEQLITTRELIRDVEAKAYLSMFGALKCAAERLKYFSGSDLSEQEIKILDECVSDFEKVADGNADWKRMKYEEREPIEYDLKKYLSVKGLWGIDKKVEVNAIIFGLLKKYKINI